jgi:putative addiction module component (TIGR02574 family)
MPEIQDLSIEERIRLVGDIWDSIAAETGSVPVDAEHLAVVRRRLEAYRVDGDKGERTRDAIEVIRKAL